MPFYRNPLFHFTCVGAALFAGYTFLNSGGAPSGEQAAVRIGAGEVRWLSETFSNQWRRPPSSAELEGLVAGLVEEELLAREARGLGLDRDDTVVRRRLAQKMDFMLQDTARLAEPSDDELRRYRTAHPNEFASPVRVAVEQVYFSPSRRASPEAEASRALAGLKADPSAVVAGDPLLLEPDLSQVDEPTLSSLFGPTFAAAAMVAPRGTWAGPIQSGYGWHLVRVATVKEAAELPFEAVRDRIATAWRIRQMARLRSEYLDRLRGKYGVEVEPAPAGFKLGAAAP